MKKAKKSSDLSEKQRKLEQATVLLRSSGALFDTLDLETYKQRLDSFSLNELYNEAFRVGLKGGVDRTNCTRAILEVFNDYRSKFAPNYGDLGKRDNLPPDKRQRALDLMKDGR